MEINQFIEQLCGTTEKKEPKAILSSSVGNIIGEEQTVRTVLSRTCETAIVSIINTGKFIEVYISFKYPKDIDFNVMTRTLTKYEDLINNFKPNVENVPFHNLTLMINGYDYNYLSCVCPILWTTMPKEQGQEHTIIKLVYIPENVAYFEMPNEEIEKANQYANSESYDLDIEILQEEKLLETMQNTNLEELTEQIKIMNDKSSNTQ